MKQNRIDLYTSHPFFLILFISISQLFALTPPYSAIIDPGYSGNTSTISEGIPVYKTIGEALHHIPETNEMPFIIYIKKGYS